jgi:hypothetical protein
MSQGNNDEAVWDVYNEYRTARLNVLYYTGILHGLRRQDFWMEIALAVAAPTSAVAGLGFWNTDIGGCVWKVFAAVAAVLAVVKPFLKLTEKIAKLEEIVAGYRALDHDLGRLTIKIHQDGRYSNDHRSDFEAALEKKRELVTQNQMLRPDPDLQERCEAEVMRQLPVESFFVPETTGVQ